MINFDEMKSLVDAREEKETKRYLEALEAFKMKLDTLLRDSAITGNNIFALTGSPGFRIELDKTNFYDDGANSVIDYRILNKVVKASDWKDFLNAINAGYSEIFMQMAGSSLYFHISKDTKYIEQMKSKHVFR